MNRLFINDKSFFVKDKKWVYMGEFVNIYQHIWRRLHWCWVTEHICSLFLA